MQPSQIPGPAAGADPGHPLLSQAGAALEAGELEAARSLLDRYLQQAGPARRSALIEKARVLFAHRDRPGVAPLALQAAETACAALPGEPHQVAPWHLRASLLAQAGRTEESLVAWKQALRCPPDPLWGPQAAEARLAALEALDRPREQLETCELALAHASDPLPLLQRKARLLELLERPAQALPAWERVLQLRADHEEAHYRRSVLLAGEGRGEEAVAALQQAVALNPERAAQAYAEPALQPLRDRPGFPALPAPAKTRARPQGKAKASAGSKTKPKARAKPAAKPAAKSAKAAKAAKATKATKATKSSGGSAKTKSAKATKARKR